MCLSYGQKIIKKTFSFYGNFSLISLIFETNFWEIAFILCVGTPQKEMCFEKSYTFRAHPVSVAYFDQRLGVAHSKRWSKSLFLTFFVLKIWKTSKKKEICCKILQKRILFLASSRKMIFLKWIFSNVM